MAEIKGYLLTEEEEKACFDLVKKLREKKVFTIDFSGRIQVKAKTPEEARDIFWMVVGDMQDKSLAEWSDVVTQFPYFERGDVKEE